MTTVINNEASGNTEFFKRVLYSFQVLMVGIALPLLFLVGISDGNQKKLPEDTIQQTSNTTQLSAKPIVGLFIPRI